MDTILLLSIFFVFVTAFVGGFIQRRKRDRVLADLEGFHTTIKLKNDKLIWGRMSVFPNGLELVYARPHQSRGGHTNTSYIMFKDSINEIQALYRYHTELSPANQERRRREVARTASPGLFLRWARNLKNFLNTFRDAINESLGMLLTRMKGTSTSILFRTQDQRLQKIGTQALGAVGNAYDAILERYISRHVIVELVPESGKREEYCGMLKEYSPSWLSVLDCRVTQEHKLSLADSERLRLQRDLDYWLLLERSETAANHVALKLRMKNQGAQPVHIKQVESEDYRYPIGTTLAPGESEECLLTDLPKTALIHIELKHLPYSLELIAPERQTIPENCPAEVENTPPVIMPDLHLVCESLREVDVYIPRTLGTLRHGSDFIDRRP